MRRNKGSALITVMTVMVALSIAVGSLIPLVIRVQRFNDADIDRLEARSCAYSGLQAATAVIAEKNPDTFEADFPIDKGAVRVTIRKTEDGFEVQSEGISGDTRFILKKVFR